MIARKLTLTPKSKNVGGERERPARRAAELRGEEEGEGYMLCLILVTSLLCVYLIDRSYLLGGEGEICAPRIVREMESAPSVFIISNRNISN